MTLELTIQAMFDHYPLLFQTRDDCLNHLFCTLGNGYAWQDGELVSPGDPIGPKHALVDGMAIQHERLTVRSRAELAARIAGRPITEDMLASLPDTPIQRPPKYERWYFVHRTSRDAPRTVELYMDYVPLWNVPDGIRPDWADGAAECLEMLAEDGVIDRETAARTASGIRGKTTAA